jgi:transposase
LPQNVKKEVKHGGGSLQVWGCLTWGGTGHLHRVDGRMNAVQYCEILQDSFFGSLNDHSLDVSDIIFVQDNDPKHTSKLAKKWFIDHDIELLNWAPCSPDMNIIEHAWDEVDRHLRARNPLPRNLDELWDALVEEWGKLDISYVRRLYESMPHRVKALAAAKGRYTKY